MSAAATLPVVTPTNLGPQFYKDPATQKFRISVVSTDATNVAVAGSDGGAKVTQAIIQANQLSYTFGYDPTAKKLTLYQTTSGTTSVVSTVDPNVYDLTVNGATLANGKLTLTETNGGASVTVDLNAFLQEVSLANTNAISLVGGGHANEPLTATLVIDPETNNILKVGVAGARVDTQDILTFLNGCTTITTSLVADDANGVIRMKVGGSTATAASIVLTDANGVRIGSLFA